MTFEAAVSTAKVFVDTCSLMHPLGPSVFLGSVSHALKSAQNTLIVPWAVMEELKQHQEQQDAEKAQRATEAIEVVTTMRRCGLIDGRGENNDDFPINSFWPYLRGTV